IRISIYRFTGNQLQRLCRTSNDPREIASAIENLTNSNFPSINVPLTLPPSRHVANESKSIINMFGGSTGWLTESALAVLEQSVGFTRKRLLIFSEGHGGTDS